MCRSLAQQDCDLHKSIGKVMDMKILRGDVIEVDFNPFKGSEQGGIRPAVVLQNDIGNKYSPTVIVAPITSEYKGKCKSVHAFLPCHVSCLPKNSWVLLEQIKTIDKTRIIKKIGSLNESLMHKVDRKLRFSLGM